MLDTTSTRFLLNFLKNSGVCIALDDNTKLFFPDLAPANEPEIKQQLGTLEKPQAVFEFLLPYFPVCLSARLVSHWMKGKSNHIESSGDVWREGFILKHYTDKNSFLIIRYQFRKASLRVDCVGEKKT